MIKASMELIIRTLNQAQVRYLVVGGIAVIAHGYVRATKDIDLLIQLDRDNLLAGLRALEEIGYRPAIPVTLEEFANPQVRAAWISEKQMKVLNFFCDAHLDTPVDVFVDDPLGFDDAYRRGSYFPLSDNLDVPVCSYEDLIRLKLLAGRPSDLVDLNELKIARGES